MMAESTTGDGVRTNREVPTNQKADDSKANEQWYLRGRR